MEQTELRNTQIRLDTLTAALTPYPDGKVASYGFLCVLSGRKSYINSIYKDKSTTGAADKVIIETVIFDSSKARILLHDGPLNTWKNVYLVRYACCEQNPDQPHANKIMDYQYPVEVLRSFSRDDCSMLRIEGEVLNVVSKQIKKPQPKVQKKVPPANCIKRLEEIMDNVVSAKGKTTGSYFPIMARQAAIANFRDYAETVGAFIGAYLPGYVYYDKARLGNQYHQDIIVKADSQLDRDLIEVSEMPTPVKVNDVPEEILVLDELDALYEAGAWVSFLASPVLRKIPPAELPDHYFEMAVNCAEQLLNADQAETIKLDKFQQQLFAAKSSTDLVKEWKNSTRLEGISQLCLDGCIADGISALKLVNTIGYTDTNNMAWRSIRARFVACKNRLIPHIFLINAFVSAKDDVISDFCTIIKGWNSHSQQQDSNMDPILGAFQSFLVAYQKYILQNGEVNNRQRTTIFSIYLDIGMPERLHEVLDLIAPEPNAVHRLLMDLMEHGDTWTAEQFSALADMELSKMLLAKCVGILWDRNSLMSTYNSGLIHLLAWVLKDYGTLLLEEILQLHYSNTFTKLEKRIYLLTQLEHLSAEIPGDPALYLLGSYIYHEISSGMNHTKLTPRTIAFIEQWNSWAEVYYQERLRAFGPLTQENEALFPALLDVFRCDPSHQRLLQEQYANWFCAQPRQDLTEDKAAEALMLLKERKAHIAYTRAFSQWIELFPQLLSQPALLYGYADSMTATEQFAGLVAFVNGCEALADENRTEMLTRALGENFRTYGLDPRAYTLFTDDFTVEDAIEFLMKQVVGGRNIVVNSLIALFAHRREYSKAHYLALIFRKRTEVGFRLLFSNFFSVAAKFGRYYQKQSNHFDAISLALRSLEPDALMDFLRMASQIKIPEYKDYNQNHVYAYMYKILLSDPTKQKHWSLMLQHSIKNLKHNVWTVVICERMLRNKFGDATSMQSGDCIRKLLSESPIEELPYNLLPYVCMYIMDTGDKKTLELLTKLFAQADFVSRMITDNPWYDDHRKIWSQFTKYCQEVYARTQDETVYTLMQLTDMTLHKDAIKKIQTSNQDKRYLFKQICNHYLNGEDLSEITNLLDESEWENLSASDAEMLKVLRTIFAEDEYFLTEHEELYPDAESVRRLKKDCARILREYPSKKALYEFDENCTNLAHKFLVHTVVLPVLYDEEIYKRCWQHWCQDITDRRTVLAYYAFLESVFLLQLNVNAVYEMLYKRFRYLKLYINMVCQHGIEGDDSFIIAAMEQHQHMEQVYNTFYMPMKHNMAKFMQISGLSHAAKIRFLEGLVNAPMTIFLTHHDAELEALPSEDKAILRRMLEPMDWRVANVSLYEYYWPQIQEGSFTRALAAAEAFSTYTCDALHALQDGWFDKLGGIDFYNYLVNDPGKKLKTLSAMKKDLFERNRSFLIPVFCSRVFPYRILENMRFNVLHNRNLNDRYKIILDYLTQSGCSDTAEAYYYLQALLASVLHDRKTAAQILKEHDLTTGIPPLWENEAAHIRQYASGESENLVRDQTLTDPSRIVDKRKNQFSFVNQLAQKLGIRQVALGIPELKELYRQFKSIQGDPWKQMQLGIQLLSGYGRNRAREIQDEKLPAFSRMAIDVGMIALAGEINLSVDDKIAVASDLYSAREYFRKCNMEPELLDFYDRFRELLRRQLNIATWIRHRESIREFLATVNDAPDFPEVFDHILTPCMALMEPAVSLESRITNLRKLIDVFRTLPSPGSHYARDVERAIGAELRRLADGTCLRVSIVNVQDTITDGCVYFQVENVGKRTASLKNDNITIFIRSGNERERSVTITDIEDLRSGFVTGGSYRLQPPAQGQTVNVTIRIIQQTRHGEQVLCSTAKQLGWIRCEKKLSVRKGNEYEVSRAVSQERLLYGRDKDKDDLSWCVPQGVTVIYGPSRIGKTSLLNWVQNDLAKKQGNVMTLLYGGEKAAYKFSDWSNKNFADDTDVIPYDDDRKMSEYLLSDTIIHGLDKSTRFTEPYAVTLEPETLDEIRRIMQKNTYLIERYYKLDKYLSQKGLELWLLLDEFQQIVLNWEISCGCDFHSVCSQIGDDIHNIKFVFCGSDELLKHMVLKKSSEWKSVLQGCQTHQVEPLDRENFERMIREEPALAGTNIEYSESALQALFNYTDGVALYGKEICNALLRDIQSVPGDYDERNTIYISDIAKMTQRLLNDQADELSTKMKETISKIYKEVAKNLDADTHNILWYMARRLDENPQEDGFDEHWLYDKELRISKQTLEESLTIARARGIIRSKSKAAEHQGIYVFRTLFYYFAFLGSAPRMPKLEEALFADPAEENEIITEKTRLDDLVENFKLVDNKRTALQTLYANMEPDEQEKYLRGVAPRNMAGTINFAENIQINSQTINNTFNSLLAGPMDAASFAKALTGMPSIGGYIDTGKREILKELTEQVIYAETEAARAEIREEIQGITASAEEEMLSDTLGAAVRTDGFLDVDEARWISLLGLSGQKEYDQLRELPAEFFAPLGFAVMLHNIFQRIEDNAPKLNQPDMDFCPVAIMYCKVVENLLKKLHTPIYVHKIGHIATIKKGVYFKTLLEKDGVTISDTKDLSIGSFSVNIAKTPFSNHVDERRRFVAKPITDTIQKLVGGAGGNVYQQWCDHAWALSVIRAVRNKSAHEAAPITRENFDWLLEELFHKGGLLRIAALAKATPV